MDYRSYQQVLDLSDPKETLRSKTKAAKQPGAVKKRTKSGCLTCRSRKKKCDENKIDGKCQACIRNFLDCCWPSSATSSATSNASVSATVLPTEAPTTCENAEQRLQEKKPTQPSKGASAYPSPLSSPKLITVEETHEKLMKGMLSTMTFGKVSKQPRTTKAKTTASLFVVTSFDKDRVLCQIASK